MVIPTDLASPLLGPDKKENFEPALLSALFGIKLQIKGGTWGVL
jgi:hypothetical protein